MDGLFIAYHPVSTGGRGEISFSNTINLPAPNAAIAEIPVPLVVLIFYLWPALTTA